MLDLVDLTPDRDFYHGAVLDSLAGSRDDFDAEQRFSLAAHLAKDGNARAKRMMYEGYKPGPKHGESIGAHFVDLDGLDGALFVADKMGELVLAGCAELDTDWFLFWITERLREEEVLTALLDAGRANKRIEAYRLALERAKAAREHSHTRWQEFMALSYVDLQPKLRDTKRFRLGLWGGKASEKDVRKAAEDLSAADNDDDRVALLSIFSRRAYPADPAILLQLTEAENKDVALSATIALGRVQHRAVRNYAFQLINQRRDGRHEAIAILKNNFSPGDHQIALDWFEQEADRSVRHQMGFELRKLWEMHSNAASEAMMLQMLYEKGPCSSCREYLLPRLIELGGLTDAMKAECAWDANQNIREFINKP